MARNGVDYETIKQTALKLLSHGAAPSVQKIREVLGTGSNTTIAEHLKVWREEYANQKIHHLPPTIPKELLPAIEVLWQTAMEQATQQLSSIKTDLMEQQEKLRLDKTAIEQALSDLRSRLLDAENTNENKNHQIQTLQTQLAVTQEQLKHQHQEIEILKNQYESRLKRAYDEKNSENEKAEALRLEIIKLKDHFVDQEKKFQHRMNEERILQEHSELRWVKLIDQTKNEAGEQRKNFDTLISRQSNKIDELQSRLSEIQNKYFTQQPTLELNKLTISDLSLKYHQAQEKYAQATATIAMLQERLNQTPKKFLKPKSNKQPMVV